ncbi:MAG: type 1 glutamine amidotransferase [Nocardioides sp.]
MAAPAPSLLVIEHEPDDPPLRFGAWLQAEGIALDVVQAWDGDALPEHLGDHAGLLVMGGWMSAHHDEEIVWLAGVKQLLREAARDAVPTVGICLGHQVATVALGGHTGSNPAGMQFGLLEVGWTEAAASDPLFGPAVRSQPSLGIHWNDDIVHELPPGGEVLARAPGGEIQAARFGPAMWGMQWHPEVDEPMVRRWAQTVDHVVYEDLAVDEDTERVLAEIDAASPDLEAAWRPLARSFAAMLRGD